MNLKVIARETILLILLFYLFFEGVYKVANWHSYSIWIHHAPLIDRVPGSSYIIAIGEILLSLVFLVPSWQDRGLYIVTILSIAYILWVIIWHFFTSDFMLPYEQPWKRTTWFHRTMISSILSWIAFFGILLSKSRPKPNYTNRQNVLRNMAANAQ